MTETEKWIRQASEREALANKLIELEAKDFEEFDELKDVPVETLQTWIIEALEEENKNLREKLKGYQTSKQTQLKIYHY